MSKKKQYTNSTADLLALELLGVKFVKLNPKTGICTPKKGKKGATHRIEGTSLSTIAEPLKKWPKAPAELTLPAPIGSQPEEPERPANAAWHQPIPDGASYAAYRWKLSGNLYITPITSMEEVRDFRGGDILFGKLRYGEDFVIMSPEEEAGNVIRWKDGVTCFADGKDPESLKKKAKQAAAQAQAIANPPAHVKEAFKAQAEKRRVPPGPRPGDVAGVKQNGVRKPGAGGKTARIWDICDALLTKLGRVPTKQEVLAEALAGDPKTSPGMTGTQHSYWRRFYGHNSK